MKIIKQENNVRLIEVPRYCGNNESLWAKITQIKVRVYDICEVRSLVWCDCLIECNPKKYESREFPRYMFAGLADFKIGTFAVVQFSEKVGTLLIEVQDAKGTVEALDFDELDLRWNF